MNDVLENSIQALEAIVRAGRARPCATAGPHRGDHRIFWRYSLIQIPDNIDSKYRFVILSALRARQIQGGSMPSDQGTQPQGDAAGPQGTSAGAREVPNSRPQGKEKQQAGREPGRIDTGEPMKIALGVSGGIACYKAAEILRRLQDRGFDVVVVMTKGATQFVTPLTFRALSGNKVYIDIFEGASSGADFERLRSYLSRPIHRSFPGRSRHRQTASRSWRMASPMISSRHFIWPFNRRSSWRPR